jgi:hypothetical protein
VSDGARLAGFGVVLALALGVGLGIGAAVGPLTVGSGTHEQGATNGAATTTGTETLR